MTQRDLASTEVYEKSNNKSLPAWIIMSLIVGTIFGVTIKGKQNTNSTKLSGEIEATALLPNNIQMCFAPAEKCTPVILQEIALAKDTIYVQAYGFFSPTITDALVAAHKRGVKVNILLDKRNLKDSWSKMKELIDSGIEVTIDRLTGIAHNKVMIIDSHKTITGSFNFTRSADSRNAENVIIISDDDVAKKYIQNWISRKASTSEYFLPSEKN